MIPHYQHKLEALLLALGIENKEEEQKRSLKYILWYAWLNHEAPERVWWMHMAGYNPCS